MSFKKRLPKCPECHPLKDEVAEPTDLLPTECEECGFELPEMTEYKHCEYCDYDICLDCYENKLKALQEGKQDVAENDDSSQEAS